MADSTNKINARGVHESAQTAESLELSTLFGANINSKWFEALMQNAGTYFFSANLALVLIKLAASVYDFTKLPNKTFNKQTSLVWTSLQIGAISAAILGTLLAAPLFFIATPALFTAALGADALINIGSLIFNSVKLAFLYFQRNKQLNAIPKNENEKLNIHLTEIKFEALKKKYIDKIKTNALASVIGVLSAAAVAVIFLFPKIHLAAVGTAGITIGGYHLTVAAITGIAAACGLTIPAIPSLYQGIKWGLSKIGNGLNQAFSFVKSKLIQEKNTNLFIDYPDNQRQPLIDPKPTPPAIAERIQREKQNSEKKQHSENNMVELSIINDTQLTTALDHQLAFNASTLHSQFREVTMAYIDNEDLAKKAIVKMVDKKLPRLIADIGKSNDGGYGYFTELERHKREQKLHALVLIKQHFTTLTDEEKATYNSCFKKILSPLDDTNLKVPTLDNLIDHIETNLPGVKKSLFLNESDTQNIIEALKVYAHKFSNQATNRLTA